VSFCGLRGTAASAGRAGAAGVGTSEDHALRWQGGTPSPDPACFSLWPQLPSSSGWWWVSSSVWKAT